MNGRPWTKNEENQLFFLINEGKNPLEVAEILGRTPGAVQTKASSNGWSFKEAALKVRATECKANFEKNKAALLKLIKSTIENDEPMPRNIDIARKLRLPDQNNVNFIMRRLKEDGLITVIKQGPTNRIVTLCETGQKTRSPNRKHSWGALKSSDAVEPADPKSVEDAKRTLRRAGFSNVYNAEIVHADDPNMVGKYCVGRRFVSKAKLFRMAKQYSRKKAA